MRQTTDKSNGGSSRLLLLRLKLLFIFCVYFSLYFCFIFYVVICPLWCIVVVVVVVCAKVLLICGNVNAELCRKISQVVARRGLRRNVTPKC